MEGKIARYRYLLPSWLFRFRFRESFVLIFSLLKKERKKERERERERERGRDVSPIGFDNDSIGTSTAK
jgi:hypothetical protein